ncbi:hypothetical protein LguiB_013402 [Lonicera macranthoides]
MFSRLCLASDKDKGLPSAFGKGSRGVHGPDYRIVDLKCEPNRYYRSYIFLDRTEQKVKSRPDWIRLDSFKWSEFDSMADFDGSKSTSRDFRRGKGVG